MHCRTKNSSDATIDPAHEGGVHEVLRHEGVDGDRKSLGRHHQQVGNGQVHDEDVGLAS